MCHVMPPWIYIWRQARLAALIEEIVCSALGISLQVIMPTGDYVADGALAQQVAPQAADARQQVKKWRRAG